MKPSRDNRRSGDDDDAIYEVHCTEPDGTREVDVWGDRETADQWADWCRQDGCTDVEVVPVVD
jgi:1,4-alpha-glucan branching enzyme